MIHPLDRLEVLMAPIRRHRLRTPVAALVVFAVTFGLIALDVVEVATVVRWAQHVAFVAWVLFIAWYWGRSHGDWVKSTAGQNIMGVALNLAGLIGLILLAVHFGDYESRPYLQVLVYGGTAILAIQRTAILESLSRPPRPSSPDRDGLTAKVLTDAPVGAYSLWTREELVAELERRDLALRE